MSKFDRWMRAHRNKLLSVLVISFILMDFAVYIGISSLSTGERGVEVVEYPMEIRDLGRSSVGNYYVMTESAVYRTAWYEPFRYIVPGSPTSIEVAMESDTLALVTDNRYLSMYWSTVETPDFTEDVGQGAELIAFSQKGSHTGYQPKNVYLLVGNETGDHLKVVGALLNQGDTIYQFDFPQRVAGFSKPDFILYLSFTLEDDSIWIYDEAAQSIAYSLQAPGKVVETCFSSRATYLGIIYETEDGRRLLLHDPFRGQDVMDIEVPSDACHLAFEDEGVRMYLRSGDMVMRYQEEAFVPYFEEKGLRSFIMPSVADYVFAITDNDVVQHSPGEFAPRWRCPLDNASSTTFLVDASGYAIVGFRSNELVLIDNYNAVEGAEEAWLAFGLLVALQVSLVISILLWRRGSSFKGKGFLAMWTGALVGVLFAGLLPDEAMIEWYGSDIVYLMISGTVSGLIALYLWNQQTGAYSIAIGAFIGMFLGVLIALGAAFVMALSGYVFPGTEGFFITCAYGLATGFKMGLVGGAVGMALEAIVHPRHLAAV
ncbi:MAG: hypothetical protein MUE65_05960 [Methanomassiliicoccales archaeon]|nr:hypothetical protein [Methanomassiliicoccales archaeon]